MDNAGENKKLEERMKSKDWKLNIEVEYTAARTPQQDWPAEVGFYTLMNRARALMAKANLPTPVRHRLWRYAVQHETLLDGYCIVQVGTGVAKTRYEHILGSNPKSVDLTRTWGEAGTVTLYDKKVSKLNNRGVHCLFVGYATNHPEGTYAMYDPKTNGVHTTRDIVWLHRMYYMRPKGGMVIDDGLTFYQRQMKDNGGFKVVKMGEGPSDDAEEVGEGTNPNQVETVEEEDDDDDPPPPLIPRGTAVAVNAAVPAPVTRPVATTTRSGRTVHAPSRLIEEMGGIGLTDVEQRYYSELVALNDEGLEEFALVGAGQCDGIASTKELKVLTYDEAMSGPDKDKWIEAVDEEYHRMMDNGVFEMVHIKDVPLDADVIDSTWAMKKKASGVYRGWLAGPGFKQHEGKSFDPYDLFAPVVGDITIRVLLVLLLMAMWLAWVVDVKGTFLKGKFEPKHKVYMKVPKGFEKWFPENFIILLRKTLYGIRQVAKAFWKLLLWLMNIMKFERHKAEPCLYYRWTDEFGLIVWISFIDDMILFGTPEGVRYYKELFLQQVDCDDVGPLKEYLGAKIDISRKEGVVKITQSVLLRSFRNEFTYRHYEDEEYPELPAAPGQVLTALVDDDCLDESRQSTYRTGVGKLLYLVKWSRPEIGNAVRELSCFMSKAVPMHEKAMEHVMKYCLGTEQRGFTLKPDERWDGNPNFEFKVSGISDSDFAKDPMTRKSVSGVSVFLCEAPVAQRSKMQNCRTLSIAEAELVAAVDCATIMMFVMQLLEGMGLKVQKPMLHKMDCKGAIDLIHNWSTSGRTRHIDVRYHYLRELNEAGIIHTVWIDGEQNPSDLFTKNLGGVLFHRHSTVYTSDEPVTVDIEITLLCVDGRYNNCMMPDENEDSSEEEPGDENLDPALADSNNPDPLD
ncbi:hypothetical protein ACA910_011419 [Epithemia clementina (nom. ined.)]